MEKTRACRKKGNNESQESTLIYKQKAPLLYFFVNENNIYCCVLCQMGSEGGGGEGGVGFVGSAEEEKRMHFFTGNQDQRKLQIRSIYFNKFHVYFFTKRKTACL